MIKKVKYESLMDLEQSDFPQGELAKRLSDECETNAKNSSERIGLGTSIVLRYFAKT